MKPLFNLLYIFSVILFSCNEDNTPGGNQGYGGHECGVNESDRIGAVCNDGTNSTATGSDACSSHNGVKYWICK